ncbi:MAG: winged helix-turn-helix transcriptional regulator [Clostridia bacterium]|nr:winged helix-turn-helix transcriptional regulator [Clostridia bacterium]
MNLKVNGRGPEPATDENDYRKTPMVLINDLSRLLWKNVREHGIEHPISQKSGQLILLELAKRDGRTQLDLANATNLKAPTISVSLQKLEKEGYVSRRPDEYDLRATRVFLTEKGRALDATIKGHIRREEALATANLTDEESDTLVKLLLKIRENLAGSDREEETL